MERVFSDFPLATDIYKSKRKFQMREILTRPSSVMPIDKLSDIEIILKNGYFKTCCTKNCTIPEELTGCTPY